MIQIIDIYDNKIIVGKINKLLKLIQDKGAEILDINSVMCEDDNKYYSIKIKSDVLINIEYKRNFKKNMSELFLIFGDEKININDFLNS